MEALKELFGTDIGLLSLFTIGFIIVMAIYLYYFVRRHMREDEKRAQARAKKRQQQKELGNQV